MIDARVIAASAAAVAAGAAGAWFSEWTLFAAAVCAATAAAWRATEPQTPARASEELPAPPERSDP